MKISNLWILLVVVALANGCASFHHRAKPAAAKSGSASTLNPIVTPDNSLTATVAAYNATGQFVILSFPVGRMPKMGQTLFLYRSGLKVGEVKVTGPQRDNNIAADLITGEAQVGDEVRGQ